MLPSLKVRCCLRRREVHVEAVGRGAVLVAGLALALVVLAVVAVVLRQVV